MAETPPHGTPKFKARDGTISSAIIGEIEPSDEDEDFHVPSAETLDTIVNEHRADETLWHKPASLPAAHEQLDRLHGELRRLHTAYDAHKVDNPDGPTY